jgi:hypothetical protein
MYILGLSPSWGTSRMCPAWSPSEHQLTLSLSPIGARVRSHAVRRKLFIFLMTAAHISLNVFFLRNFLSNIHVLILHYTFIVIHTYYTSHSDKQLQPFVTWWIHSFISLALHSRPAAFGLLCLIQWGLSNEIVNSIRGFWQPSDTIDNPMLLWPTLIDYWQSFDRTFSCRSTIYETTLL